MIPHEDQKYQNDNMALIDRPKIRERELEWQTEVNIEERPEGRCEIPFQMRSSYTNNTEMSYLSQAFNSDAVSDAGLTDCGGETRLLHEAIYKVVTLKNSMGGKGNWATEAKLKAILELLRSYMYQGEQQRLSSTQIQFSTVHMNDCAALCIMMAFLLLVFAAIFIPLELKDFPELPAANGNPKLDVVYIICGVIFVVMSLSLLYYGRRNHVVLFGKTLGIPKIPKARTCYTKPMQILVEDVFIPTVCWDKWGENQEKWGSCFSRVAKWIMDTVRYNAFYHFLFILDAILVCVMEGFRFGRISLTSVIVEWFVVTISLTVFGAAELRATDHPLLLASVKSFSFVGVVFLLLVHCIAGIVNTIDTGDIYDPLLVMDNFKTYTIYVWINLLIFITDAIHRPKWAHLLIFVISLLNNIRIIVLFYITADLGDTVDAQIHLSHVTSQQVRIWTVILLSVFNIKCIFSLFLGGSVLVRPGAQTHFDFD